MKFLPLCLLLSVAFYHNNAQADHTYRIEDTRIINNVLYDVNGDPVTVADIPGTGIYLFWYESQTDSLQLLTGNIAA